MFPGVKFNKVAFVVGSNYGDEGKGQTTREVVERLVKEGETVINVRYGGSAQAGHTVETSDSRFVYKHFGAGSFLADTYLAKDFIMNPVQFVSEHRDLAAMGNARKCYCSPDCIITTPEMMTLNQLLEAERDVNAHGTCGMGVYEAIHAKTNGICFRMGDIVGMSHDELFEYFYNDRVIDYYISRYNEVTTSDVELPLFREKKFSPMFMFDVINTLRNVSVVQPDQLSHTSAVFEGSQGMLLTPKYGVMPHCTPSLVNISDMVDSLSEMHEPMKVDVYFVSRSYATRHGNGPLTGEMEMSKLGLEVYDPTNAPNPFQGTIRYAPLDLDLLTSVIQSEIEIILEKLNWGNIEFHLVVTCLGHSDGLIKTLKGDMCINELLSVFTEKYPLRSFIFAWKDRKYQITQV